MWSFSYTCFSNNFFVDLWAISYREVTVRFLNQVFIISKYPSLSCYDTVFRTRDTTTWVDEREGFDFHLYPFKGVWQIRIKATTQFCKLCKLHYGYIEVGFPRAWSWSWLEIRSVQSFYQLATKASKLLCPDFEH